MAQSASRTRKGRAAALRQLLLMRHAKSSWDDPRLSDHARPLNARGRQAAAAMRQAMRELGLAPDVVLVSSARRTLQTLEALEPWDDTPLIEPMDALYLASRAAIADRCCTGWPRRRAACCWSATIRGCTNWPCCWSARRPWRWARRRRARLAEGYPTGALAEFSVAGSWRSLGEGGGRLLRFLCPRDLPELAV